jgi:catechol 2,3-dioxygenase-like lactoylglutathione lyase family enzyme
MVANKCKIDFFIGHVGVEVSDLKRSRMFYQVLAEAFGWKVVYESKETIGFGDKDFQIWLATSKPPRVKRAPPTGQEMVISEHLAIYVKDKETVDEVDRAMRRGGFPPLFPPEEHTEFMPGYYCASYCDPDNYVIEIFTHPK